MTQRNENTPDPRKIEKELGEFLNKKFGGKIKVLSPSMVPKADKCGDQGSDISASRKRLIHFDIRPDELIAHLDQYIVRQDRAKSILATKICTHFNRIRHLEAHPDNTRRITGSIKSNILMLGPTGVGKTYLVKLIARKIGVPFVKGDATKFSETGYVGGDVEDLIRDLVKEADDDIEMAQYGIVYIDEIDKIAASRHVYGADVSRSGVQRALLKPMEDTDVSLKVPHDPVSMMQELDSFQKTGKRSPKTVNTANILFIVSGAFSGLSEIIEKRVNRQSIGFGSDLAKARPPEELMKSLRTEDLLRFGFESEFVGRLPVRTLLEPLSAEDLFTILRMPNNPVILGKRLDFAAYGIEAVFTQEALQRFAELAFQENTGARGLVSVVESHLMPFEERLPASGVTRFTVTPEVITDPETHLEQLVSGTEDERLKEIHTRALEDQHRFVRERVIADWEMLTHGNAGACSSKRAELVAACYQQNIVELGDAVEQLLSYHEAVKEIELTFFKQHELNLAFSTDAVDFIMEQFVHHDISSDDILTKIYNDFYDGLSLIRQKTGNDRFFISRAALLSPEPFLENLIRKEIT